jgi:hypothetical protein
MSSTARRWLAIVLAVGSATIFGLGMGLRSRTRVVAVAPDETPVNLPAPAFAPKPFAEAPAPRQMAGLAAPADKQPEPEPQLVHTQLQGKVTPQLKQAVDELRRQDLDRLVLKAKQLSEPLSAQRK